MARSETQRAQAIADRLSSAVNRFVVGAPGV